jgi:ribosomal protein L13
MVLVTEYKVQVIISTMKLHGSGGKRVAVVNAERVMLVGLAEDQCELLAETIETAGAMAIGYLKDKVKKVLKNGE